MRGDFKTDLDIGLKGQELAKDLIESMGYARELEQSDDEHKGDFMFIAADGTKRYLEVKNDTYTSGNISLEIESTTGYSTGWAHPNDKTYDYDILWYQLPNMRTAIVMAGKTARKIIEGKHHFRECGVRNSKAWVGLIKIEDALKVAQEENDGLARIIKW